jgi:hypothetical protein
MVLVVVVNVVRDASEPSAEEARAWRNGGTPTATAHLALQHFAQRGTSPSPAATYFHGTHVAADSHSSTPDRHAIRSTWEPIRGFALPREAGAMRLHTPHFHW